MKWCEHISYENKNKEHYLTDSHHGCYTTGWSFCPICGTPRPKPKSLEEKFREAWFDKDNISKNTVTMFSVLASIAKEHYSHE